MHATQKRILLKEILPLFSDIFKILQRYPQRYLQNLTASKLTPKSFYPSLQYHKDFKTAFMGTFLGTTNQNIFFVRC